MGTKKTTAPAIDVPQSDEGANLVLAEYALAARTIAALQTDMEFKLAQVKAGYEGLAAPYKDGLKNLFEQLQAFAAANRDRLTEDGKTKTVDFPAGKFGWRARPPSVRFQRGVKLDDIIAWLKRRPAFHHFLRTKIDVNKEAMLDDPAKAAQVDGILIGSAGEDFFIEPFGAGLSEPAP